MNIVLIGFKSVGKTSVGQHLAAQQQCPFLDTDNLIEQNYQKLTTQKLSVREIYQQHGETYFRQLEHQVICDLNQWDDCIIATGGGSLDMHANKALLRKNNQVIYLSFTQASLRERFIEGKLSGFASDLATLHALHAKRKPLYMQCAHIEIATDHKSIALTAAAIMEFMYGQ